MPGYNCSSIMTSETDGPIEEWWDSYYDSVIDSVSTLSNFLRINISDSNVIASNGFCDGCGVMNEGILAMTLNF